MNIYATEGTEVKYTGEGGYKADQDYANKYLTLGETYTVDYTIVHDWYTDVYLKEVRGMVCFNSALFEQTNLKMT